MLIICTQIFFPRYRSQNNVRLMSELETQSLWLVMVGGRTPQGTVPNREPILFSMQERT